MKLFSNVFILLKLFFKSLTFFIRNQKIISNCQCIFFFPSYHTGGAEKVHLDIVNALSSHKEIVIFFTNPPNNQHFLKSFQNKALCLEVSEFLEKNLRIRRFFEFGLLQFIHNSKSIELVFGSNSTFYYDILPKIRKNIKIADLIHAFSYPDYGFESYSLNAVPIIDIRVIISDKTLRDFKSFYSRNGLDRYFNRLKRIHNLCEFEPINVYQIEKKFQTPKVLNIAWIGRNSIEKRLNIYNELADSFVNSDVQINFNLVTDERGTNPLSPNIIHFDRIEDSNTMKEFLSEQHLLIITSYREGLPLVYMEAISQGVIVLSTKVGALPDFIEDGVNGFLFDDYNLVLNLKEKILEICSNVESLIPYAKRSINVFKKEFSPEQFRKQYFELLIEK